MEGRRRHDGGRDASARFVVARRRVLAVTHRDAVPRRRCGVRCVGAADASSPIRLGILAPRGERAVLTVPIDTLMRISYNPFFTYIEARTRGWVDQLNGRTG